MNTSFDKRTKVTIMAAVLGLFALVVVLVGVFLFKQRELAPDDSDAAVEPVTEVWIGDIWKKEERRVQTKTFQPPANFKSGTVKVESYWGWSAGRDSCEIQMNESHSVNAQGLGSLTMEDLGNGKDQDPNDASNPNKTKCEDVFNQLKDLGYSEAEIGSFNFDHYVDDDPSTWFSKTNGTISNAPKVLSGDWDESKGGLRVTLTFTGLNGPPEEWCSIVAPTGTKTDDAICNGSHGYKIVVTWSPDEPSVEPSETSTPTPTATPTNTVTPTATPLPEKANLGDFVWVDANRNGVQDDDEEGLSNVTVELYEEGGTTAVSTTRTGEDGKYSFNNIDAGTYYLIFKDVLGYARTGSNIGENDVDSDANVETGRTELIELEEGQTDNTWDAGYFSLNAAIRIIKSEIADHANATDFQIVAQGGTATFHIRVTNIGEVDLENVVVTDELAPGCARDVSTTDLTSSPVGVLVVGQSVDYSCQRTGVTESFDNIAVVTGDPVTGGAEVTDEDDSAVTLAGTPAIKIVKSEQEDHSIATDTQTVESGGTAKFYITVKNIGAVELKDVKVTDVQAPGCSRAITEDDGTSESLQATLALGESVSYTCEVSSVEMSFVNVAEVIGKSTETNEEVTDEDPSKVVVPGNLDVSKSSSMVCQADTAAVVSYTISISNPTAESRVLDVTDMLDNNVDEGMLSLSSVSDGGVYDSGSNEIVWSDITLSPNGSKTLTYQLTVQSADFDTYENTVVVEQDGVEVGSDTDSISVMCLPATGLLDEGRNRIVVPVVVILLGVAFVAFKGHEKVGRLFAKDQKDVQILEE